jgi:hypothetical protein
MNVMRTTRSVSLLSMRRHRPVARSTLSVHEALVAQLLVCHQ